MSCSDDHARLDRRRAARVVGVVALASVFLVGSWVTYEEITAPSDPSRHRDLPPVKVPPARSDRTYVRVITFGDEGTGGHGQSKLARTIARRHEREPADLLLLLGDSFYPTGVDSVDDPQWETKVTEPYGGLGIPVFAALGNHDHKGDWRAQVARTAVDPIWHMPAPWYSFVRSLGGSDTVEFFVLDTTVLYDDPPSDRDVEQLEWLDGVLSRSTARFKIVAGHHPVRSHANHRSETLQHVVEPVLIRHRVDLYLAGHDHTLQVLKPHEGVTYCVSGGGAGDDNPDSVRWEEDTLYAATRGGFVALRIDRDEIVIEVVRPSGDCDFATVLPRR